MILARGKRQSDYAAGKEMRWRPSRSLATVGKHRREHDRHKRKQICAHSRASGNPGAAANCGVPPSRGRAEIRVEPVSKSSEEENKAGELDESKEVLGVVFPADENAALPLDPRKEAFDEPAAHVAG